MPLEVASLSAMGATVGLILCGKRGFRVADQLDAAILRRDIAFEAAYGESDEFSVYHTLYIPKFHHTKHLPDQLRVDGFSQDTFATERKHSMVKLAADPIRNTVVFERSVLSRALLMHLGSTQNLRKDGLIDPQHCPDIWDDGWISLLMVWEGTKLGESDVVFLGGDAVLVCGCVCNANASGLLGRRLTQVRQITSACAAWRPAPVEEVEIFALEGVRCRLAALWSVELGGDLLVIEA